MGGGHGAHVETLAGGGAAAVQAAPVPEAEPRSSKVPRSARRPSSEPRRPRPASPPLPPLAALSSLPRENRFQPLPRSSLAPAWHARRGRTRPSRDGWQPACASPPAAAANRHRPAGGRRQRAGAQRERADAVRAEAGKASQVGGKRSSVRIGRSLASCECRYCTDFVTKCPDRQGNSAQSTSWRGIAGNHPFCLDMHHTAPRRPASGAKRGRRLQCGHSFRASGAAPTPRRPP